MLPDPLRQRLHRYRDTALRDDLVAAFIVAVLLIPQCIAYALLSGLPPEVGVYASLLPMLAYAALASSSVSSVGPAAVPALMTGQAIAGVAALGVAPVDAALVLACEVGVLLALAALFKLDALASLLSTPVLHGFSTGASLSIALSQMPVLLGNRARGFNAPDVLGSWWATGQWGHGATAAFGIGALLALMLARRHAQRWAARWLAPAPAAMAARCAPLLVIAVTIASAWWFNAGAHGVAQVGRLPALGRQSSAFVWAVECPVRHAAVAASLARIALKTRRFPAPTAEKPAFSCWT